jgi:hypothetical protein
MRRASGADGTRTRALLAASQSLSQLSYGPSGLGQCSRELVILCPIDELALVVSRRMKAEENLTSSEESLDWQEVAAREIRTVGGKRVDFLSSLETAPKTFASTSVRIAPDIDHVAVARRPLALHPQQVIAEQEDHVEAPALGDGAIDLDPEFCCGMRDRRLRDSALLIRRQHRQQMVVVRPDD